MKAGYSPEECDARLMFQFGKGLVGEQDPPVEVYIVYIVYIDTHAACRQRHQIDENTNATQYT